jgi:hypothetical protein
MRAHGESLERSARAEWRVKKRSRSYSSSGGAESSNTGGPAMKLRSESTGRSGVQESVIFR